MFYARFTDSKGQMQHFIYYDRQAYFADTFSPATKLHSLIDFTIRGRSYKEKQNALREIAINWQSEAAETGLYYSELATIYCFFKEAGRRFGLLREFKENCIC